MESHANVFTQNSRHTSAATERRNGGIETGSESAEVKFLDKHNASGDSGGEYGYGLRLASQPASQPATVALASPPSSSSGLLSYFFSSRHSPLTRFHSCVSKKRTFAVVCVRARERLFSAASRDCVRIHARASVSRMRMCRRRKQEGGTECELGGIEVLQARRTDRDRFSFVKCHAE